MGKSDDQEVEVEVEVKLSGCVNVRMKLSQAKALAEEIGNNGEASFDPDDYSNLSWDDILNACEPTVTDIDFEEPSEDEGRKS